MITKMIDMLWTACAAAPSVWPGTDKRLEKDFPDRRIVDSTRGGIDRVTGDVGATVGSYDAKASKIIVQTVYTLKCKPAQRMF
jgi:hypothetical protein